MEKKIENANSEIGEVELDIDFGDESDVETIKAKAKEVLAEKVGKITENNKQLYARVKKAEGFELKDGKWVKSEKPNEQRQQESKETDELSQQDVIALVRANIHDDDIETVQKFAKMENILVKEALKNDDLKAILERRANIRKSADVTSTATSRRTVAKADPQALLSDLSKGKVPEKGTKEAEELFWARRKK